MHNIKSRNGQRCEVQFGTLQLSDVYLSLKNAKKNQRGVRYPTQKTTLM